MLTVYRFFFYTNIYYVIAAVSMLYEMRVFWGAASSVREQCSTMQPWAMQWVMSTLTAMQSVAPYLICHDILYCIMQVNAYHNKHRDDEVDANTTQVCSYVCMHITVKCTSDFPSTYLRLQEWMRMAAYIPVCKVYILYDTCIIAWIYNSLLFAWILGERLSVPPPPTPAQSTPITRYAKYVCFQDNIMQPNQLLHPSPIQGFSESFKESSLWRLH